MKQHPHLDHLHPSSEDPFAVPLLNEEEAAAGSSRNRPRALIPSQAASTPLPPPHRSFLERRRSLLLAGSLLTLLMVGSALFLPVLLTAPPSNSRGMRTPVVVGTVSFASSGQLDPLSQQGLGDRIAIELHGLAAPEPGKRYDAWLLPDRTNKTGQPLLLSSFALAQGKSQWTYQDPHHRDLLTDYSGFGVTEQASQQRPEMPVSDPHAWRACGWLPQTPTPGDEMGYSQLSHLRHLLAQDPLLLDLGLAGGLSTWLLRNAEKLFEYSTSARDSWAGTQTSADAAALMQRQFLRILEYLDGQAYAGFDLPQASPWLIDAHAGRIGLLDVVAHQDPPGYLAHVGLHVVGFVNAPGATAQQRLQARSLDQALSQVKEALTQMRKTARLLSAMTTRQLQGPSALSLLNDLVIEATLALEGHYDAQVGGTMGGIQWIQARLQQFARITVVLDAGR